MYIINEEAFRNAMTQKGYHSIGELADTLKMHRNTVHYYLSGRAVFPQKLEQIFEALQVTPREILFNKEEKSNQWSKLASLIDQLHTSFTDITFILFGSRARNAAHPYADWDVGVYCSKGLSHEGYRKIRRKTSDLAEALPFNIDIVNLNKADQAFLKEIAKDWRFLTGSLQDWLKLQEKVRP
jgi:predicted nucleotidyltransferase